LINEKLGDIVPTLHGAFGFQIYEQSKKTFPWRFDAREHASFELVAHGRESYHTIEAVCVLVHAWHGALATTNSRAHIFKTLRVKLHARMHRDDD
jgi:hypothetical protein